MCGLIYKHHFGGQAVNGYIMEQFGKQRNRGLEGFGLWDGQHNWTVKAAQEKRITRWLRKPTNNSNLIMFHHRNPTSTINVKRAAHPFTTGDFFGDTTYILIHNGYLFNDDELYLEHQELGIKYQSLLQDLTFNDSEALLWDFALYMEGWQPDLESEGAMAIICAKLEKGKLTKLYFGRNTSPLVMNRTKDSLELSSEGYGEIIVPDQLYTWNYDLKRLTKRPLIFPEYKSKTYYNAPQLPYTNRNWKMYDDYDYHNYRARTNTPPLLKVGDWVDEHLKKKFGLNELAQEAIRTFVEYEADPDTQEMKPVEKPRTSVPTDAQVETCVMLYLIDAHGNFDTAYWNIIGDYGALETKTHTVENEQKLLLLDEAVRYIEADPEYVSQNSQSSLWEAIWQQQHLAV